MLEPNSFYTYLREKYDKTGRFDGYELFYAAEISNPDFFTESWTVKPTGTAQPYLDPPTGGPQFELKSWDDRVGNNIVVIQINIVENTGGKHKIPLIGSIIIREADSGNIFRPRKRWEEISVMIEFDHPPQTDTGSSTSHFGDAD